ncbi:glycosyltransferase family 2 protein [Altericista sp. CCNU0014]|uniref:glycosyltransferase family 2 protein n=1 Tax=Altericista sp. CCNU0014 TaxID=3082949 RepID=UPI00385182E3
MDVSIIIPTYNRLWCLSKAIESCRNTQCQSEIIVVDDGSTDGTWKWLQAQEDVIAIWQPNQGQTWAINRGTLMAKGQYIRFLDSDDILCDGTIDKQFQTAIATEATLVYSRVDSMEYESGRITECPEPPLWDDFLAIQLGETYGSHFLGMLFHRDLVEKVPRRPDFAYREDRMFLLEVGLLNPKLAHVSGCAGYWVKHEQQMQGNYRGMKATATNWQHLNIYKRILSELYQRGELTSRRRKAACKVLWPLAHWIALRHPEEACEVAEWIYQLDPDFRPPELGLLGQMYKQLGFRATERVLSIRRNFLRQLGRYPKTPKPHQFSV